MILIVKALAKHDGVGVCAPPALMLAMRLNYTVNFTLQYTVISLITHYTINTEEDKNEC